MHFDFLFNPPSSKADIWSVGRLFGYVFMLSALVVGGYLVLKAAQDTGPTSAAQQQMEDSASQVSSAINLQQAVPAMEAWYTEAGTYVGAIKLRYKDFASLVRPKVAAFHYEPSRLA